MVRKTDKNYNIWPHPWVWMLDGLSLNEDAPALLPAPGAAAMEDAVWPDAGGSGC